MVLDQADWPPGPRQTLAAAAAAAAAAQQAAGKTGKKKTDSNDRIKAVISNQDMKHLLCHHHRAVSWPEINFVCVCVCVCARADGGLWVSRACAVPLARSCRPPAEACVPRQHVTLLCNRGAAESAMCTLKHAHAAARLVNAGTVA